MTPMSITRSQIKKTSTTLAGAALLICSVGACSSSDGDEDPAPAGGINGPARVDPDTGVADNGGDAPVDSDG